MEDLTSRTYTGAPDLELLIEFARRAAAARWPRSTYKNVGDVVWEMYNAEFDNCRLWFDGSELVAYASFGAPFNVEFDIVPGLGGYDLVADEILEWAQNRTREVARVGKPTIPKAFAMLGYEMISLTRALDSDRQRIALMERRGFDRAQGFDVLYRRGLTDPIELPPLNPLLRLRQTTDSDLEARVDVHRDAWSVWGPSAATVENYRRLRNSPIYDPALDVVLEDAGGRFLAYCVGWLDTANGIGHFEPVGCRPSLAGRGYARAVIIEGMRRMQARGMHTAMVFTPSVNQGARALYPSCAFVEVDRAYHYTKSIA